MTYQSKAPLRFDTFLPFFFVSVTQIVSLSVSLSVSLLFGIKHVYLVQAPSLSFCLFFCLSFSLSVCLSVCLSASIFGVCLSFCPSVCANVCLSVCLSVRLSVFLSVCLCHRLSVSGHEERKKRDEEGTSFNFRSTGFRQWEGGSGGRQRTNQRRRAAAAGNWHKTPVTVPPVINGG